MAPRLRIPGEWEPHRCCWLAYPYLEAEWPNLDAAQRAHAALCRAIAVAGKEPVKLLVPDEPRAAQAAAQIGAEADVEYVLAHYGDCWTRDTLPLFGLVDGKLGALRFRFNGWGGKFAIAGDEKIGPWVVERREANSFSLDLTLEGGALEFDGEGRCIVTRSCALNPNRNPGLTPATFTEVLQRATDVRTVVWLSEGLPHDHTDGHVDMVARFAEPGVVMCACANEEAPEAGVFRRIERELRDHELTVLPLPTPGPIEAPDRTPLPANYCNFYVANEAVFVPQYGIDEDAEALSAIERAFPTRHAIGLPALDLLWGGGSFHCITQPEPMIP